MTLDTDKSINSSRRYSNCKHLCTKQNSCMIYEANIDIKEKRPVVQEYLETTIVPFNNR